jgi:glycosyltransferase involved in cell wall biosynthesis
MRPAVLLVDHATALGGAEHFLLDVIDLLDRSRFLPYVAAPAGALADAARRRGVSVCEVPLPRLRGAPTAAWRWVQGVSRLTSIIRRERISLVYSNGMRASLYAAVAARLSRRPHVWQVHDIFPSGTYVRAMSALSQGTIAVSAAAAAPLPGAQKVSVIHNGVRLERFRQGRRDDAVRLRAAWGVPRDSTLIGQVARLQPWKGQGDVIAAAAGIVRASPRVYFAIVGGDIFGNTAAYERGLKADVARRGLSDRVVFTGHQDDIAATLPALDMVVHASTDEPFGRILIEAGAAGLAVVAYAGGGVPEIVVHEHTGLLVPQGDVIALAAALQRLVSTPSLARALGDAARAHVAAHFDARRVTQQVEVVFQRVLDAG